MSEQHPARSEADGHEVAEGAAEPAADGAEPEWVRKRRLAEIFGDVLPETTGDERDERPRSSDDWLKSQVPPHHGG
ncbi:hypothetical protein [Nocardioides sp. Iso805N]|uniref:hypothetical protein n=1 Tax=Nocardioides sp. Iso805N TaxID=1283287 RepID=UPI000370BE3D|nr:hypothetical protein [Nocardioides sp. Iso805N]